MQKNPCSLVTADDVSYGSGTVADALDNMSAEDVSYGDETVKDALDEIKDSLTYSTSEHIIGEWIDGRTIYEITVDCGALPNNTTKVVSIGALGQDIFISLQGIAIRDDKAVTYDLSGMPDLKWYVASTGVNIITTTNYSSYNAYVTFRYVKP